jgi:hypothetical protein
MKRNLVIFPIVFIGALFSVFVQAAVSDSGAVSNAASRPATRNDLVGTWELVSIRPTSQDKKDPVFFPHQRYRFNANSSMKLIASEKPLTKEWLDKFEKQPAEIDYSINEKGIITFTWNKPVYYESAICALALRDVPPDILAKIPEEKRAGLPKKGHVTLSYLDKSGKVAYQKVLSKIKP